MRQLPVDTSYALEICADLVFREMYNRCSLKRLILAQKSGKSRVLPTLPNTPLAPPYPLTNHSLAADASLELTNTITMSHIDEQLTVWTKFTWPFLLVISVVPPPRPLPPRGRAPFLLLSQS